MTMRYFKQLILLITALISLSASAWNVPDETLHYSVRFKWGFIDANVGIATLTTKTDSIDGSFTAMLTGKTIDLFGHYYAAADTISGSIMVDPNKIVHAETLTAEHGQFQIETVTDAENTDTKLGPVVEHLPDGQVIRSRVSNYGAGITINLLSAFYYMRQPDYSHMTPGESLIVHLNSDGKNDLMTIRYNGLNPVCYMGEEVASFHISLDFQAVESGKSDHMDVWISTEEGREPLRITGSVSVGTMECELVDHKTAEVLNTH